MQRNHYWLSKYLNSSDNQFATIEPIDQRGAIGVVLGRNQHGAPRSDQQSDATRARATRHYESSTFPLLSRVSIALG
ncbi:MAG: hypothetical protein MHMPM18_001606 [Marteilia pararefringens]